MRRFRLDVATLCFAENEHALTNGALVAVFLEHDSSKRAVARHAANDVSLAVFADLERDNQSTAQVHLFEYFVPGSRGRESLTDRCRMPLEEKLPIRWIVGDELSRPQQTITRPSCRRLAA